MTSEELTDDYVAKLLARDAKESSIRYSAMGLQGFGPSKPPANKPKPNTRFLRNIIKDTDNHNAALLAKEAAEARARLRTLSSHQEEKKKPVRVGSGDIRRRQLGDIAAILGGRPSKRRRTEETKKDDGSSYMDISSEEEKSKEKSRQKTRDRESRRDRDDERSSRDHRSRHRRDRSNSDERGINRKERRRDRSRSPREYRDRDSKRRDRSRRRKRSSSLDDRHEAEPRSSRYSTKSRRTTEKEPNRSQHKKPEDPKPDYDSDPLDDIIGPRPPEIKIRGRGTASHASGIDARFSAKYDPTTDVTLDPDEENDWDQALEALKDRQRWKQQGADRLRAAGFTDEEVKKWESGGEKREADVRWAKKGEGREWDRGKVLGEDGVVTVESSFGRLTGM